MTAVIGILNKNAVAIAADSAVTVSGSNGKKIYNTANKIFTLSKYHPVSIIIYNSSDFIHTPWEIIIKIYRNQLKETSFSKLEDYSSDFFRFIKTNDFFSSPESIRKYLQNLVFNFIEDYVQESYERGLQEGADFIAAEDGEKESIVQKYLLEIISEESNRLERTEDLADFSDLEESDFNSLFEPIYDSFIKNGYNILDSLELRESLTAYFFKFFKSKEFKGPWTGLVFAGYGDDDIYPKTISTKIAGVINNRIRFYTDNLEIITDEKTGSIMPFAQRDVIDTLITGISPDINMTLFETFNKLLTGYNEQICKLIEEKNPGLSKNLSRVNIEEICNDLLKKIEEVKQVKHIFPTVQTVSVLSKEDLAEMAESLIYLTYLKRRISSDEESVGGPVDVAVISKGDGFIWIKRKHYFEEKYNMHFSKNYFGHT